MGVYHLWPLLGPCGHRLSLDTLQHSKLAVDVSIWLTQFLKALPTTHPHLLGLLRRLCKLHYYHLYAVFVFDGPAPNLKKRTIEQRRRQRNRQSQSVERVAERLLLEQLKMRSIKELRKRLKPVQEEGKEEEEAKEEEEEKEEEKEEGGEEEGYEEDSLLSASMRRGECPVEVKNKEERQDRRSSTSARYSCPSFSFAMKPSTHFTAEEREEASRAEDDSDEAEEEEKEFISSAVPFHDPLTYALPANGELDSSVLATLPLSLQYELLEQHRSHHHTLSMRRYAAVKDDVHAFSSMQMQVFLKGVQFSKEIESKRTEMNAGEQRDGLNVRRLAGNAGKEYIYLKKDEKAEKQQREQQAQAESQRLLDEQRERNLANSTYLQAHLNSLRYQEPHVWRCCECGAENETQEDRLNEEICHECGAIYADSTDRGTLNIICARPHKSVDFSSTFSSMHIPSLTKQSSTTELLPLSTTTDRSLKQFWNCLSCTFCNEPRFKKCEICRTPRPYVQLPSTSLPSSSSAFTARSNNNKSSDHVQSDITSKTDLLLPAQSVSEASRARRPRMRLKKLDVKEIIWFDDDEENSELPPVVASDHIISSTSLPNNPKKHDIVIHGLLKSVKNTLHTDTSRTSSVAAPIDLTAEFLEEVKEEEGAFIEESKHLGFPPLDNASLVDNIIEEPASPSSGAAISSSSLHQASSVSPNKWFTSPSKRMMVVPDISSAEIVIGEDDALWETDEEAPFATEAIPPNAQHALPISPSPQAKLFQTNNVNNPIGERTTGVPIAQFSFGLDCHMDISTDVLPADCHISHPIASAATFFYNDQQFGSSEMSLTAQNDSNVPARVLSTVETSQLSPDFQGKIKMDDLEDVGTSVVSNVKELNSLLVHQMIGDDTEQKVLIQKPSLPDILSAAVNTHPTMPESASVSSPLLSVNPNKFVSSTPSLIKDPPLYDAFKEWRAQRHEDLSNLSSTDIVPSSDVVASSSAYVSAVSASPSPATLALQEKPVAVWSSAKDEPSLYENPQEVDLLHTTEIEAHVLTSQLSRQHQRQEKQSAIVTSSMVNECKQLLTLFGCPYIEAPAEAEAQCAVLETLGLVDGVVTEDSDVFVFGARHVYRNIFESKKFAERYRASEIEATLGLTRDSMISLALLLGSDYTLGVKGIGIVNAMEIINSFNAPGNAGLREFREWCYSTKKEVKPNFPVVEDPPTDDDESPAEKSERELRNMARTAAYRKQYFKWKHRNVRRTWHISRDFPSDAVRKGYEEPMVDSSTEPLSWSKPRWDDIIEFLREKFRNDSEERQAMYGNSGVIGNTDEDEWIAMVKQLRVTWEDEEARVQQNGLPQYRIDRFFEEDDRFAEIRSKRIASAVYGLTKQSRAEQAAATEGVVKAAKCNKSKKKKLKEIKELEQAFVESEMVDNLASEQTTKKRKKRAAGTRERNQ